MLRDVLPFERVWNHLSGSKNNKAVVSFIRFLENRFRAAFVYEADQFLEGRVDLSYVSALAERLRNAGVISSYHRIRNFTDEPPLSLWSARFRDTEEEGVAGGCAVSDEKLALTRALAEALERHIWFDHIDYFEKPTKGTFEEISKKYRAINPTRFAGLSDATRILRKSALLTPKNEYLWVRAQSLTKSDLVWLPAQTISAHPDSRLHAPNLPEPLIRGVITTGLATHPIREEALLGGALEVIERDAYIITWLNQLSPPRMNLETLCARRDSLAHLIQSCKRYRISPTIVSLPTDAPTYVICAILEDEIENTSCVITLGVKADRDPACAAEGALTEALRTRRNTRSSSQRIVKAQGLKTSEIGHFDRIAYWTAEDRWKRLRFLTEGPMGPIREEPWESDSSIEHLSRIAEWCRAREYECATVPFTHSKRNVLKWHIEMVVIPELQPMYVSESLPHTVGARLTEIPKMFGYTAREVPFTEEPHPFF